MNRHLSLRSGNPALKQDTFKNLSFSGTEKMTLNGTINKTALSLVLLMIAATYSCRTWLSMMVQ